MMRQHTVCWRLLAGIALLCGLIGLANAQSFPQLSGRVVDQAGLLTVEQETSLSDQLAAHEAQTSNQIVVLTLADLGGYDIADYANRLGRHWGIGTAENDNGVLLVVARDDRKVRIEVGYGLEGALTDSLSSVIIQRHILPAFRQNNYPLGINNGANAIMQAVQGEYTYEPRAASNQLSDRIGSFLPLIFIAIVAVPEILRRTGMRKAAHGAFPAGFTGLFATLASGNVFIGLVVAVLVFLFMFFTGSSGGGGSSSRRGGYIGSGGFGGGGFGGGGFSGGGGSFGGGGASGGW